MSSEITPFEPQSLEEAMTLSKTLATCNVLSAALRGKPADVLFIIMTGRELGLSVSQSLRSIHIIEGKPCMSADLIVGMVLKRPQVCEYFTLQPESDSKHAVYETKRAGAKPVTLVFTIAQAQQAGLLNKANWKNYPDAMLRARAGAALARAVYPDIAMGLYDPDEIEQSRIQLAPPERDVTPPLPLSVQMAATGSNPAQSALPATTRTDVLKGQLRAKQQQAARSIRIVNVADGQTEEEALAAADKAAAVTPAPSKQEWETAWEQIQAVGEKYGKTGPAMASAIKGATGKAKRGDLREDDVARVEAALSTLAQLEKSGEDEAL